MQPQPPTHIATRHRLCPQSIRANIKVSSTETGAIFGNLVYESTGYADRRCAAPGADVQGCGQG